MGGACVWRVRAFYEKAPSMIDNFDNGGDDNVLGGPVPDPQVPVAPQGFSLRPATEDDLDRIEAIERQVHVAPWSLEHFRSELIKPFSHFWVMTDDETDEVVAGYLVFWIMGEQAEILNVVTAPAYRGQGFAKYLVRKAAGVALKNGALRMVLDVRKSNQAAIGLYQAIGFAITQVRKAFYSSNGEDAYGMTLALDERFDAAAGVDI